MNDLNSVLIEGVLREDALLDTKPKEAAVCTFTVASTYWTRDNTAPKGTAKLKKVVGFFRVKARANLAELCAKNGRKGRGVRVVGRLQEDRRTGPDGEWRSDVFIVAEHIEYKPEFKKEAEEKGKR
jgi:single-strand DNA-binding protein